MIQKPFYSSKKNRRKIMVCTATRAEWYLLEKLCEEIQKDKDLELQLIVTGAHLSPEFGLTYREIEKKISITKKIPILLASDDKISLCKTMGLAFHSFSECVEELQPDIVVILGDRYEMLALATVCLLFHIPIAHLCGGELTLGAIDDSIRHSITKMSHLHFVSTQTHKQRLIQLGEQEEHIFIVGSLAAPLIQTMKFLSKKELEKELQMQLKENIYLITYHPVTLEQESKKDLELLLQHLNTLKNASLIFTKANADENGIFINTLFADFCTRHKTKAKLFENLGSQKYLSLMKIAKAVIGNSSSGILETPFFKTPCINIGIRQKGRIRSQNIIDTNITNLPQAFKTLQSPEFQEKASACSNPFASNTSNPNAFIKTCLKKANLATILHKEFIDIKGIDGYK
ncbi:UDP-N-acetylglucosamine 2-epimerase [Campylobacter sp. MIT 21-1685]|uniref:UDP-N-acetylglucosamine 2-epimerase n=1 Tax=unclassified Campylobacter TaxID=2593542 RepID=UPI00224B2EBE|nr:MULTISPECIES: UDP-N-acetylglucosamine 2-epimerase [unclassified Campylobacter]MCX2683725.1 UDP-N-acetylglucosamine 2-epimerase [Campylobacter sp. MIT 21-1684]MCX2752011.1 UDP-N-acetylglucosamine 2-epimerase [Campylobacter sp. MIT 21-1682]MCX2808206.1 UDP-N-acetylglucosamine 2-epimerase [Campylobacter sp. MIT 21-1685]